MLSAVRWLLVRSRARAIIRSFSLFVYLVYFVVCTHAEQVVISKIMYHPQGDRPEYIELFNNTATPLDIANWRVAHGVDYEFPDFSTNDPGGTFLKPFERIVLSDAPASAVRNAYNVPDSVRIFGPWKGKLRNGEERITLNDKNGVTVCTVKYADRGHWPRAADGAGHALVLRDPNRSVDDWRNWTASERPGGSPGQNPVPAIETPAPDPHIDLNQGLALINYTDTWRYEDNSRDLGAAWRNPGFDDSQWPSGQGVLGFSKDKPLPPPGQKTALKKNRQFTYYLRKEFIVNRDALFSSPSPLNGERAGLPAIGSAAARVRGETVRSGFDSGAVQLGVDQIIDDGAVYYLNGNEIARVRMPAGSIGFKTGAAQNVRDPVEELNAFSIDPKLLLAGTNLLAVEVHQDRTNSSDLAFAMRLRAFVGSKSPVVLNELALLPNNAGFVEFFNSATNRINLKNYFLTDTPDNLRKTQIKSDFWIPPAGLAALGFAQLGLTPTNLLSVYLLEPDGATLVDAVGASFLADTRPIGRKPAGAKNWFRFPQPTRGQPNATAESSPRLKLNELHFTKGRLDWIELYNPLAFDASVEGLFFSIHRDLRRKIALTGKIKAHGFASWPLSIPLGKEELNLYLIDSSDTVLDCVTFGSLPLPLGGEGRGEGSWQAFPDGSAEWYSTSRPTRNAPNQPQRNTDIVINEIMYDAPKSAHASEFIELFNRGASVVDLTDWELTDAVRFKFPRGAKIPAQGFLVVAADAARMKEIYGDIPMIGNFAGKLHNRGALVRVVDRWGNRVNQVDYKAGGDWPTLAKGAGSSMELINPAMDNSLSSAWRDSDESAKSKMREYAITGTYEELHIKGAPSDYKELHFHLVGESHIALQNVFFGRIAGTNFIVNGTKLSDDGLSAKGWLIQGTHWASFITNSELHLISDGRGDNRPNRAEIDVTGMTKNDPCLLRFNARWISGNPRLIAQTWDHSIAGSFLIDIPPNLGTPGKPNSCFSPSPAPQVDFLSHNPPVPHTTNTVTFSASIHSAAPLRSVELLYRLDNDKGDGRWTNLTMQASDSGTPLGVAMSIEMRPEDNAPFPPISRKEIGGNGATLKSERASIDMATPKGVPNLSTSPRLSITNNNATYTAELTGTKAQGQIFQFYVRATAQNGITCVLPRGGADEPAMFVVDNRRVPHDLRTARFIVSAHDLAAIADGNTPHFEFKYPRHSNRYFNVTFISNEEEIFYNGKARNSGSPWTRSGGLDRPKFKLPEDRRFRSHSHFYFDNDPAGGNFHNRVTRYWLYLMGHPVNENEIVRVVVNGFGIDLREDTEPLHNDFLDRNFHLGSKGQLYRIDDEWWFMDNWDRDQRDADWGYKGSDNPGRYRTEWMKRTNEADDDFSDLIAFFKLVSGNRYTQAQIEKYLDPDAILRYSVVRAYIADWDTFTMGRGKNAFFYQRPGDGRFQFFQWDSDLGFGDPNSGFTGGRIQSWLEKPYNRRLHDYYLAELHEKYTTDSLRFRRWLEEEYHATPAYKFNTNFYLSWCSNREPAVLRELGENYHRPFAITPPNPTRIVTNEVISLTGTAPITIAAVQIEQPSSPSPPSGERVGVRGSSPSPLNAERAGVRGENVLTAASWKDAAHWRFTNIHLQPGPNNFSVKGLDRAGKLLQQASISIVRTNLPKAPKPSS